MYMVKQRCLTKTGLARGLQLQTGTLVANKHYCKSISYQPYSNKNKL